MVSAFSRMKNLKQNGTKFHFASKINLAAGQAYPRHQRDL